MTNASHNYLAVFLHVLVRVKMGKMEINKQWTGYCAHALEMCELLFTSNITSLLYTNNFYLTGTYTKVFNDSNII